MSHSSNINSLPAQQEGLYERPPNSSGQMQRLPSDASGRSSITESFGGNVESLGVGEKSAPAKRKQTSDSEEEVVSGEEHKRAGRRKIKIEFIADKGRRHITFSKRKAGIMKKVSLY